MTERTTSLPTIQVRVLQRLWRGGQWRDVGETLWLTEMDLAAHASSVRIVLTVPAHRVGERLALVRNRFGR